MSTSPKRRCGRLYTTFETEHERLYGHRSDPDNPVEIVAGPIDWASGHTRSTRAPSIPDYIGIPPIYRSPPRFHRDRRNGKSNPRNVSDRVHRVGRLTSAHLMERLIPLSSRVTIWKRKAQPALCLLTNTIQPSSFHLTIADTWIAKEIFLCIP